MDSRKVLLKFFRSAYFAVLHMDFTLQSKKVVFFGPKVLRSTQILISTKFAASVSFDIFVRCYYGILKYNYKHFIGVKGFY